MSNPKHEKYNRSLKGQARNKRYEAAHPERAQRARRGLIARDAERTQEKTTDE